MKAAVLHQPNTPLMIEAVSLDAPQSGEVLVNVRAAGICHSDYHYMTGQLSTPLPAVLGHEGAGIVEAVGPGVDHVRLGDHVILLWRASCGRCEFCARGRPALCDLGKTMRLTGGMRDGTTRLHRNGSDVRHFLGVSCFAERCIVVEEAVVPIPHEIPFELAALLGCSVITGVGAVLNAAEVYSGSTVLVVGAGGVGLAAVLGARIAGASRILVADRVQAKLDWAREFGATDVVDTSLEDLVDAVRRLTGDGVDFSFDMVGGPATVEQAVRCLRRAGVATIVGLTSQDAVTSIRATDMVLQEKRLQGSLYGSSVPHFEIRRLIELYRSAQLPLARMVTRTYKLDEVNEAFRAMIAGEVVRSVLMIN